jgi:uncharacterized repeat protein (TIGR03803 family)
MKIKNVFTRLGVASREAWVLPSLVAVLNLLPAGRVTAQTFTTLHSFTFSDGASPRAELILSGNTLYGTAAGGGSSGAGTVFALSTDGTGFTNLHLFQKIYYRLGNANCNALLDCVRAGGEDCECTPAPGQYYCRCYGYGEGARPYAGLILSSNTLYGTASQGGTAGNLYSARQGTVFGVNTDGTGFTTLHSFTRESNPRAGLILSGNSLYGTTEGGTSGAGTVFALNTDGTGFTSLRSFAGGNDGAYPHGGLILSGNTLYGTTEGGSSDAGTVFALNTGGTGFTILHRFAGGSDGANPTAGLVLSGNTLYGTTSAGGSGGAGTVFAVNTDGTGFTNLHSFAATSTNSSGTYTNSDGATPQAGLILSGNTLYGTATGGGSSGKGAVFALNTDGTGFTNLHSFTACATNSSGVETNGDGAYPYAGLLLSGNTLYGTASAGGTSGNGTVFSLSFRPQLTITPSGTNVILSWPISYAGFSYTGSILQQTANLGSPDAWVLSDLFPPVIVDGRIRLSGPTLGPQRFYRLRRQ